MFVLALDMGYLKIMQEENGAYTVDECENGISCMLKLRKKAQSVRIMPIGQIVIDRYNNSLKSYLEAGGTVEEARRSHQHHKLYIGTPCPPAWIYPNEKPKEIPLSDISLKDDPSYLKVAYIQFMGQLTPVFNVEKIDDLYFYDLLRMKSSGMLIRECEDCGRAFLAKTTAVRCNECRDAGLGNKKKRDNIKRNPARALIYRIKDRNKNGKRDTSLAYQTYYANLCYIIQEHGYTDSDDELLKFAKELDKWDKTYFKLCKFFANECYEENLINEWEKDKTKFPANIENPEQWIKQWCKKAGLPA